MVKQLNNLTETVEEINDLCNKAIQAPKFMVAAWCVEDGHVKYLGKVTHNFPKGDFLTAVHGLVGDMHGELQEDYAAPPPLAVAKLPPFEFEREGSE